MIVEGFFTQQIDWLEQAKGALHLAQSETTGHSTLLEENRQWAISLAYKLYSLYPVKGLEAEDYVHYAHIGLIESIKRFDEKRGIPFQGFAVKRIRGEILNNISRFTEESSLRQYKRKLLSERISSLKPSSNKAVAPENQVIETILDLAVGFLLDTDEYNEEAFYTDQVHEMEHAALVQNIMSYSTSLPQKEQKLIDLHYRQSFTISEIAEMWNLSVGRVSQLHSKAIKALRRKVIGG